ncbi:MAG: fibronectin type III domain-containing protein [Patescibacteria group bacterium]|nr:fibronectin type III domain-containing protein [Patescibacteria group bacterium]
MKKLTLTTLLSGTSAIVIAFAVLALPSFAQAVTNLEVTFSPNPLFNEGNFTPGETATGQITVKNNSAETQEMQIEAVNQSNSGGLAQQLTFEVKQGATVLYSKTLKEFFDAGEVYLSDLSSGGSAQYDLSVIFQSGSGNEFQGKAVGFDLTIGFAGQKGSGDEEVTIFGTTTGGGGGGTMTCSISEGSIGAGGITQNQAVISWTTTTFTDSRVVYAAAGESFTFDLSASPNYGYPHSVFDSTLVTAHNVSLTGLSPATTYHYRVVSCSPSSVSYQHEFTTAQVAGEQTGEQSGGEPGIGGQGGSLGNPPAGGQVLGGTTGGTTGGTSGGQVLGEATEETSATGPEEGAGCEAYPWWWLGYVVYVLLLIVAVLVFGRYYLPVSLLIFVAAALWWWLEPCGKHLWYWPVGALAVLLGVSIWRQMTLPKDQEPPVQNQSLPI